MTASEASAPAGSSRVGRLRGIFGKSGSRGFGIWSVITLIAGTASDFAEPLAPVATNFLVIALLCLVFSLAAMAQPRWRDWAATTAVFSGIAAIIFGMIVVGQNYWTVAGEGKQRGVIAAHVDPIASLQMRVLPLTEDQEALLEFTSAVTTGSRTQNLVAARDIVTETRDDLLRRGMIETLYDADDESLRYLSVALALRERRGDQLQMIVEDSSPGFDRVLFGSTLYLSRVDLATGDIRVSFNNRNGQGTVGRNQINLRLELVDGERLPMVVQLAPQDDFRLTGRAELADGRWADIEIPLF